jgi:hypothetical protein
MPKNLLIGLPAMIGWLLLQSLLVIAAIGFYRGQQRKRAGSTFWQGALIVNGVMVILVLGNLGQVAIWALLFMLLGEFAQFRDAFYHSAVNFGTLGYGDVVMSAGHRLLGPLEAINGALMIGVSTATLLTAFQDVVQRAQAAPRA